MPDQKTQEVTVDDVMRFFSIDTAAPALYQFSKSDKTLRDMLTAKEIGGSLEKSKQFVEAMMKTLQKEDTTGKPAASHQSSVLGRKEHPFDFTQVIAFKTSNVHHSACLNTKVASTVGLGFANEAGEPDDTVANELNRLCTIDFQTVLNAVCEDYWQLGNGRMEVVRAGKETTTTSTSDDGTTQTGKTTADTITGLHHQAAQDAYVFLENYKYDWHWEIINQDGGDVRRFARFGDRDDMIRRLPNLLPTSAPLPTDPSAGISEIIEFRQPTSTSRWYGMPDWLAAVPKIELVQCKDQYRYDFYNNRGVPEFFLWLMGAKVSDDDWTKIVNAIKSGTGKSKAHKTIALNLVSPDIKVQVDKMAMESKGDQGDSSEYDSVDIVSAHGVPPILAGIQIPGRLGATNEIPNAIVSFQALKIAQPQHSIRQTLGTTLGDKKRNGGLSLTMDNFKLRTITDELAKLMQVMAMLGGPGGNGAAPSSGPADTMSRMRQPLTQAAGQGRDLRQGLRD